MELLDTMNVAKDGVHVGAIVFSTGTKILFDFKDQLTKDEALTAISNLEQQSATSCTYLALEQATNELFQQQHGRR